MPIPDQAMKSRILAAIEEKIQLSDRMNKGSVSSIYMFSDFVKNLGLEEISANYSACPWWYATNVTSTSAKKYSREFIN